MLVRQRIEPNGSIVCFLGEFDDLKLRLRALRGAAGGCPQRRQVG